jgi:hypothetical protein
MTLTSEEMSVLHGLINAAGNVSTYGYEVAVKGTVIEGAASLLISIIAVVATILVARKLLGWARSEGDHEAYLWSGAGIILTLILAYIATYLLLYNPIMSIGAPEYVVIDKILSAAANAAT